MLIRMMLNTMHGTVLQHVILLWQQRMVPTPHRPLLPQSHKVM